MQLPPIAAHIPGIHNQLCAGEIVQMRFRCNGILYLDFTLPSQLDDAAGQQTKARGRGCHCHRPCVGYTTLDFNIFEMTIRLSQITPKSSDQVVHTNPGYHWPKNVA